MKIIFYVSANNRCPVKDFICKLSTEDKAKILACLKNIEELGFESSRVEFRQIKGQLWEIKIRTKLSGYRIFYVAIKQQALLLLHAYVKQTNKTPIKEIKIAERRMKDIIDEKE